MATKSGATFPPNPTIPLLHRSIANPEAMISSAISPPNWSPPNECAVHCRLDEVKKYARRKNVQKEEEEAAKDTTTPSPEPFKACKQCGTSTTPLWRTGPNGPKSLCNACGIKYRKRRRSAERHEEYVKTKPISNQSKAGLEERLKEMQRKKQERMLMLLMEKRWKRREWKKKEAGKDEEAEAALLLMSLSSGILFHS